MRRHIIAAAAVLALSASGILAAQSSQPAAGTYQWSGELVTFDGAANTATVEARLVDQEAVADVKKFKPGDRVLLEWSGYEAYAVGIRRVLPYTENRNANDRFLLPVELASSDTTNQYASFRLRVPAGSAPALKAVKPGEWITVTSSHKATRESDAVVSARLYVTTSAPATH